MVVDEQFRSRPGAREFPCGLDRAAQVEATVDQYAGDAGQAGSVAGHGILFQPSGAREVVRADPDERQYVTVRLAADKRPGVRLKGQDHVLPGAPAARRLVPDL